MAIVISIMIKKGGSAKTSTSLYLSAYAGIRKHKVLLIDCDGQADSTFSSGIEEPGKTILGVLKGDYGVKEAIVKGSDCKAKYYDVLPSENDLEDLVTTLDDSFALKRAIEPIKNDYDLIVIDNPPAVNILSINALVASDTIIMPVIPQPLYFKSMASFIDTLNEIKIFHLNDKINVLGILLVKHNSRTKLSKEIEDLIHEHADKLNTTVFEGSIRECTVIPTCQNRQIPLPDYKPGENNAAKDYNGFVTKVFERLEDLKCR